MTALDGRSAVSGVDVALDTHALLAFAANRTIAGRIDRAEGPDRAGAQPLSS
jgi:hypothetical protein